MADSTAPIPATPARFPIQNRVPRANNALDAWSRYMGTSKAVPWRGFTGQNKGVLGTNYFPFRPAPVTDATIEGTDMAPLHKRGRLSGWGEPPQIPESTDTAKIQSAISAATRGEMTLLYQYYRDFLLNDSHVQTEFGKRKMSVVGQPHSIKPWKAKNAKIAKPEDIKAAELIEDMIESCENWEDGLLHMMDATLWPCAVHEKIFAPNEDDAKPWLRYRFRRFDPVSPFLHSYKLAYLAAGGFQLPANAINVIAPNAIPMQFGRNGDTTWDPDTWEPDLRFFRTFPNGMIDYSWASMYAPIPVRHLVHRGNILSRTIRDNYGGVMRGIIFWSFFRLIGRDWFSRATERYGAPFVLAKANMQNVDTINFLQNAFRNCMSIGGLVVNKDADVQLVQAMQTNMAQAYKIFLDFCSGEISKLIVGHEGSSTAKPEGLNSNQEETVQNVREDIRIFDQLMLKHTLELQLFLPYLRMNGFIKCHAPSITWGGLSEEDGGVLLDQIVKAKTAGLELTDESIDRLSDVTGMQYQRIALPSADAEGDEDEPEPPKKVRKAKKARAKPELAVA